MAIHPIRFLRIMGIIDGLSLITLLFIAMPLKYVANMPIFVTINGSLHGGIFVLYIIALAVVQFRIRWNIIWSITAVGVAFIPFGNFIFEYKLKKMQSQLHVKPIPKKWLVYAIIFFSFFDLFVQLPVMSTYALSVGATTFIAGIVVGMYSFMNTFGNIFSGVFTDKIGASKILIFGLCASILSLLAYQLVDDTTTLLIVRCIHGFSSGFITPAAFTLLANTTEKTKQGSGSAIVGSFVGIAAIIGPATSGILASKISVPNVLSLVALYGLFSLIAMLLFLRNIPLTKKSKAENKEEFKWNNGLMKAYGGAFFLMFSQGVLAYLLPMHVEALGYSSRMSGTLLSVFGIVAVLMFLLPTNRIFDYINSSYSLLIGVTVLGISQIIIGQSTTTFALYAALALYGMGFSFFFPAINTILIESTTKETRGKAYGYFYAFFSMGVVAGSFLLGTLDLTGAPGFWFTGLVLFSFSLVIISSTIRSKQDLVAWRNKLND